MALLAAITVAPAAPAVAAAPLPRDSGPSPASAAGAYYPTPARRLLGTATTGYAAAPGTDTKVSLAGVPGLPASGLSAAVVNITATDAATNNTATSNTAGSNAVAISAFPGAGPLMTGGADATTDAPPSDTLPPTTQSSGAPPSDTPLSQTPSSETPPSLTPPSHTPSGSATTTSVTAPAGGTSTTLVTVPLDPGGGFALRTTGGAAQVTVDLVGVYAADDTVVARLGAPGGYQPLDPVRILGRGTAATGFSGSSGSSGSSGLSGGSAGLPSSGATIDPTLVAAVPANATIRLGVDLGSSTSHVSALALRASVASATVGGTVDITGGAARASKTAQTPQTAEAPETAEATETPATALTRPYATPTLTLNPGAAASNLAFVPAVLGSDGLLAVEVRNASPEPADIRVDLVGFYDDGLLGPNLRFRALAPTRVVDTAAGLGVRNLAVPATGATSPPSTTSPPSATGTPSATATTRATGGAPGVATLSPPSSVAGDNTFALVGTATARTTTAGTDLSLWPSSDPRPDAGSVPVSAGAAVTFPVQPELGTDGRLALASEPGPADLTLDVVGSFESYPAVTDPSTRAWVDAVPSWQVSAVRR